MAAGDDSYIWIKTRDGSPTLWSNEISEPFRSTKGAFTESWTAFVAPALDAALRERGLRRVVLGEFGLGPGTNWVLWSLAARALGLECEYFVIEKETAYFEAGLERWQNTAHEVAAFVATALGQAGGEGLARELREGRLEMPRIYASLETAIQAAQKPADLWFHDPFGYAVNPEGYAHQTLTKCAQLWSAEVAGFSYACNRAYREAVEAAFPGVTFCAQNTGGAGLKRQRSEFYGPLYPLPSALK
ncbi:MAG TPA: MnmC family methyltransferase [Bdellovibrionota bacterium]|jgi:hypothetical protein|nr:MnmC family methyltransferase [Bdellovibrionota bacterium]